MAQPACVICLEPLSEDSHSLLSCQSCSVCFLCHQELLKTQLQPHGVNYDLNLLCKCPVQVPIIAKTTPDPNKVQLSHVGLKNLYYSSRNFAIKTNAEIAELSRDLTNAINGIVNRQRKAWSRTMGKLSKLGYLSEELKRQRTGQLINQMTAWNTAAIKTMELELTNLTYLSQIYVRIAADYDYRRPANLTTERIITSPVLAWYFQTSFVNYTETSLERAKTVWLEQRNAYDIFVYREISPPPLDQIGLVARQYNAAKYYDYQGYEETTIKDGFRLSMHDSKRKTSALPGNRYQHVSYNVNERWLKSKVIHIDEFYGKEVIKRPGGDQTDQDEVQHEVVNSFKIWKSDTEIHYHETRHDIGHDLETLTDCDQASWWFGQRSQKSVSYTWPSLQWISIEQFYYKYHHGKGITRYRHGWNFYNSKHVSVDLSKSKGSKGSKGSTDKKGHFESGFYQWDVKVRDVAD